MATVRALAIADIVLEIVARVCLLDDDQIRRTALVRLVAVNRVFYDSAVSALWADLPSVEPLLRLLTNCVRVQNPPAPNAGNGVNVGGRGRGVMHTYQTEYNANTLALHGAVSDHDWARFRHHAGFVRYLRSPQSQILEPMSWYYLRNRTNGPPFPFLTAMTLPIVAPYHADSIMYLLSPSLRHLTLSFPRDHGEAHAIGLFSSIHNLFGGVSGLRTLRFDGDSPFKADTDLVALTGGLQDGDRPVAFRQLLASHLCMLPRLEVFSMMSMNSCDMGLVQLFCTLPRLRELSLGLRSIPQGEDIAKHKFSFRSLQRLALSNVTNGHVLRIFDCSQLQSLEVAFTHRDYSTLLLNLSTDETQQHNLQIVSACFPHLRELTWKTVRSGRITGGVNLSSVVRPLGVLEHLHVLSLSLSNIPVSDEGIAVLAKSLPRLTQLRLTFDTERAPSLRSARAPSLPSARSFSSLARGCPALSTLSLSGARVMEADPAASDAYECVYHGLRVLLIERLECVEETMYPAMVFDRIFPFLNVAECRRALKAPIKDYWRAYYWWDRVLCRLQKFHEERA